MYQNFYSHVHTRPRTQSIFPTLWLNIYLHFVYFRVQLNKYISLNYELFQGQCPREVILKCLAFKIKSRDTFLEIFTFNKKILIKKYFVSCRYRVYRSLELFPCLFDTMLKHFQFAWFSTLHTYTVLKNLIYILIL